MDNTLQRIQAYIHEQDETSQIFTLESARQPAYLQLMSCTPKTFRSQPPRPELTFTMICAESSVGDILLNMDVNGRGFNPNSTPKTKDDAEQFRQHIVTGRAFTAFLNGEVVAAGMFKNVCDSITELAGIATLEAYRRRGIATYLTAYITQVAFENGVEVAWLSAIDEHAGRVYERTGYRTVAYLLENPVT